MRRGSTMLELFLALTILAAALTVALESMVQVSSYSGMDSREGDLVEQSRRIARHLHEDLANSAWFIGTNSQTGQQERIFPKVIVGSAGSYGDQLFFLRLVTERLSAADGHTGPVDHVDFTHRPPVPMDAYPRGTRIHSLVLNPNWSVTTPNAPFTTAAWESASGTLSYADALDVNKLRHYRYVVRPDLQTTGRGVLWREYRNGTTGEWTSDRRIADNIVSVRINTNAEDPTLNPSQIRIRVVLQADDLRTGQLRAKRTLDLIVAMRSGSNH